jgi:hypothetical protein
MKGEIIQNVDLGDERYSLHQRLEHYQIWCVEIGGVKYHVHSVLTGTRQAPKRSVTVHRCNGDCSRVVEIPEEVRREVSAKFGVEFE